jgi:hypothetical protein
MAVVNQRRDMMKNLMLVLLVCGALAAIGCGSGGSDGDNIAIPGTPTVIDTATVGDVFSCTSFITYPDGGHTITPNPRFADLAPCVLFACLIDGVCYYSCPRELIDDSCRGAR